MNAAGAADDATVPPNAPAPSPSQVAKGTLGEPSATINNGRTRPRRLRLRRAKAAYYDKPFESAAKWLLARGVHPNHFTFLQVPVFAATILAAVEGWNWPFVLMIGFVIVLDGGDGILARVGKLASKTGAVLDSIFDTLGIAVVMWGATKFFPEQEAWLMFLFLANTILYLQNALLGRKVVAYIRGPILAAVAFPAVLPGALVVATFIVAWLVVVRAPASFRALLSGNHAP